MIWCFWSKTTSNVCIVLNSNLISILTTFLKTSSLLVVLRCWFSRGVVGLPSNLLFRFDLMLFVCENVVIVDGLSDVDDVWVLHRHLVIFTTFPFQSISITLTLIWFGLSMIQPPTCIIEPILNCFSGWRYQTWYQYQPWWKIDQFFLFQPQDLFLSRLLYFALVLSFLTSTCTVSSWTSGDCWCFISTGDE